MTSSSDRRRPLNVPPPEGSRPASAYARFIPREELQDVRAWRPGSLGGQPESQLREEPAASPLPNWRAHLAAVRQEGYEEGYRDGLVALEGFKKSYAEQMSERVGQLLRSFDGELSALESEMARALAHTALLLARQVLRDELQTRPQAVVQVAREALDTLAASARQVIVRVHPDDLSIVGQGAQEVLQARGARLQADPAITRGGCRIESELGAVDATVEARWARAAAGLGHELPWAAPAPASPDEMLPPPAPPAEEPA
jgi:flagellar assembly protein FliH